MALDTQDRDINMAVVLRNASKSYDKGKTQVLDKLNMFIPRGCIYGLLGASGCGKTTLISVLVGLLKLDEGEVKVLGGTPGQKNSGVPGPRVGFMPQDAALVSVFTVKGAIFYFGWLFGMKNADIATRFEFLSDLLDLPPDDRTVSTLSGGELRRVSFAAAVVHSPELLILDEPTVGLDPILRQNIWEYFVKLSTEQNVTILLTTHYIEEAKQADKVALLRNGSILAETSPSRLLNRFGTESLEHVFMILSQKQSERSKLEPTDDGDQQSAGSSEASTIAYSANDESLHFDDFVTKPHKENLSQSQSCCRARVKALMYKNVLKIVKNVPGLVFFFLVPLAFMTCFFTAIGNDVVDLPIGIVNDELGNCDNLPGGMREHSSVELLTGDDEPCHFKGMSCLFMSRLNDGTTRHLYYDTLDDAIMATTKKQTYSTLHIQRNFTEALQLRHNDPYSPDNSTLNMGQVRIWLDMAEYTIGYTLKQHFFNQFKDLSDYIAKQCNLTYNYNALPIQINEPLLGKTSTNFKDFMAPGTLLGTIYHLSMLLTVSLIIAERNEGIWDRNIVAGVSGTEIVLCELLAELCTITIQSLEIVLFSFFTFNMEILGSVFGALCLVFLQALVGASTGLLIGVMFKSITVGIFIAQGFFFPYLFLNGSMWPIEGMYFLVRYASCLMPGTLAASALRNIMSRGWPITHSQVYPGFLASFAWLFVLIAACIIGMKMSRS